MRKELPKWFLHSLETEWGGIKLSEEHKRISEGVGLPPGTPVYIGEERKGKVKISIIDYSETEFQEKIVETAEECFPFKEKPTVTWINVIGVHDVNILQSLGTHFGLHPLVIEDIMNTYRRPKMEDYGEYIYIVVRMVYYDKEKISSEQISIVLRNNTVISFMEKEGNIFDPIKDRILNNKGLIRGMKADYLTYALIDAVTDNYFLTLERLSERIEAIEEQLVKDPQKETINEIHKTRRETLMLRRAVLPLREVVNGLQRSEITIIEKSTKIYLRDVYDHMVQIMDVMETFRDMLSNMVELYMSSMNVRLNEVMKFLTVIVTIFTILTFIVGNYGMNFRNMPEIEWKWGYPTVLIGMLVLSLIMLIWFRKKKWI
jgi:magnesium transporter